MLFYGESAYISILPLMGWTFRRRIGCACGCDDGLSSEVNSEHSFLLFIKLEDSKPSSRFLPTKGSFQ